MSETLPEPPAETPDLAHVYGMVCDIGAEVATLLRILSAPPPTKPPADSTEGIPECYADPVAQRVRARRRRIAASGLRVAGLT